LAESGLLIELGDAIEPVVTARVMALTAAIDGADLPGLIDVVPSYTTVLVAFDPNVTDTEAVAEDVRRLAAGATAVATAPGRLVTVPVAYGGDYGPDLAEVADQTGLVPDDIVTRHAAAGYRVACMGFAPGFPYLVGLPPELATPRRATPRTRVPAGSVAIGGAQTGIYPAETPGGWHLIGRTPIRLFAVDQADPFFLRPGDQVRFQPISAEEFEVVVNSPAGVDPRSDADG